jgi:hypothetical protein
MAGPPKNPAMNAFYGRERVLYEIVQGVLGEQPASFSLVGPKLVGKSQLLGYLASEDGPLLGDEHAGERPYPYADASQVVVARADCNRPDAQEDLLRFLYDMVAEQVRADRGIPVEWATVDAQTSSNRRFAQLARQLHSLGYRLVLLLDNFDRAFAALAPDTINELRPLTLELALVVATEQPLHDLDRNLAASPLFNVMTQLFIGLVEAESARRWLEDYAGEFPTLRDLLPDLLAWTGAHPFLLRRMGDILVEVEQLLPPGHDLSREHLPLIRLRLAEHGRLLFETLWRRLQNPPARVSTAAARALVEGMVGGPLSMAEVGREQMAALNWLINQAVVACCVTTRGTGYELFSPLFADYAAERIQAFSAAPVEAEGRAPLRSPAAPAADRNGAPMETPADLTKTEMALLSYFRQHSHQVIPTDQLLRDVWRRPDATARRVQEAIRRLRLQLERADPPIGVIENDRGRGYRFVPSDMRGHETGGG